MEETYLGLSRKYGVVITGCGKQYTFTKGWGKYKKKFKKIFNWNELEKIDPFVDEMLSKGWSVANVCDKRTGR